ncbi:LysE family translocator [Nereida sp. MMG025]|uniref:LysE family translocator n=1 Tax=Nereida sp. MMG025 TaxID=2909981 RepID=UPI001F2DD600|nr:LysE family translocator [Nereida sp. MMG025]MCF6444817.1 LysE family translocator [Nereida sp. MMG025]
MSFHAWIIFASFWVVFVTTPGPNAVNCIQNGMTLGFLPSLWGVLAILTQATVFMLLSAAGVAALLVSAPEVFAAAKVIGAAFLIYLGLRGWRASRKPIRTPEGRGGVYLQALGIATINAKSVTGYLAAFTQFVQPDVPIWSQMGVIMPTALTITALSYTSYTAVGAGLGKLALGAVMNLWVRRAMAFCFIIYGALLGGSAFQPNKA